MILRSSVLVACGLLCGACVGTNPYYIDPTTATTTGGPETTTGDVTIGGGVTTEASSEPETSDPTLTEMTTSSDPFCGDGFIDEGEECDDGPDNGDGECSSKCEFAFCGDGEEAPGEECDEGRENGSEESACTFTCEDAVCGDSLVSLGEECDNGENNVDGDSFTCLADCTQNVCGDGYLSPDEMCDPKVNLLEHCNLEDCTLSKCGDGVLDGMFEQCDVKNMDPNCLPNCMFPPAPTGLVGGEVEGGLIGSEEGGEIKIYCDLASFVGFYGKIDTDELWLAEVGARCGKQTVEKLGKHGYIVVHGDFFDSEPAGTLPENYDEGMTQCHEEEVLVGVAGTDDEYVTSLSAICMKVTVVSVIGKWLLIPHLPTVAPPLGDDWDMPMETVICPVGHAVSRVSVYADTEAIAGVEVYCKKIDFVG